MKLCCYFNYAPHYRESIFKKIDKTFDTQFYFGRDLGIRQNTIKKIDYTIFKKKPIEFENKFILGKFLWRTKLLPLAFKKYDTFLLTGDLCWSYIPFLFVARFRGIRVYGWGHGVKKLHKCSKDKLHRQILSKLNTWLIKNYNGFFIYGEKGRDRMVELGFDERKLYTIFNSLNEGTNEEKNSKLISSVYRDYFDNENPTLLFIGRLTPVKRLDWVIRCLKSLEKENIECNLIFIGDGTEKNRLQQLTVKFGLQKKVWFYGQCHDENKLRILLYNAELCLSPGNVGLTVIHAMTYGLPTISNNDFESQMPEYEAIVNEKTGNLFKKDNYKDFYEKVKKWITQNSCKRIEVRQNCYEIINKKFNSNTQIEIFKKVFF